MDRKLTEPGGLGSDLSPGTRTDRRLPWRARRNPAGQARRRPNTLV